MNPELMRNLWLELTQRRVIQMVVVLGLIFLTAVRFDAVAGAAEVLFYGIVVLWGTRDAAQSVVSEIRERTWDSQRLSALTPFQMTWGKLLGATSYVWLGGSVCLAVLIGARIQADEQQNALADLYYYVAVGLLAQGFALFASLIAVRRRQTRTRFNVFLYQAAGIAVGYLAWSGWRSLPLLGRYISMQAVKWWGFEIDARSFYLASLAIFLFWVLTGCYRLMRAELQVQNHPTVWLAFILFMAGYVAGFEDIGRLDLPRGLVGLVPRFALAHLTLAALTYFAMLFEPKDIVLYGWLRDTLDKGRLGKVLSRLQCWMIAYAAAMLSGVALISRVAGLDLGDAAPITVPMVCAGMGFLTRDLGVFLFFGLAPGQKRGDLPAVITLAVLYLLLPQLVGRLGGGVFLLLPTATGGWVGAAAAWAEAAAIWFAVIAAYGPKRVAAPADRQPVRR